MEHETLEDLVPNRDQLLSKIEAANQWTAPMIAVQLVVICVLAVLIDWTQIATAPLLYVGVVAMVIGPFFLQILRLITQNKTEIGKLRETTWFGDFDKFLLRDLFDNTLEKLGLPNENLPVYITADRTMNAYASHVGLGVISKRFNGIYLNRQLLHKFDAEEVQDTMGHELGHYYAHYLKRSRYHYLSCILGGLLAISVFQWLGLNSVMGYLALICCASVAFHFTMRIRSDQMQAIEFLCDDFGSHVNGVAVGITALMKLGASVETETTIFYESILSNQFSNLNSTEILHSLQQAIPYGHVSPEELKRNVDAHLKQQSQTGPSISGFLEYAWQGDAQEEADEMLAQQAQAWQQLRATPRLPWESLLDDPTRIKFEGQSLEKLVAMIEANPGVPLFHELIPVHDQRTHPPTKFRILYLWHNRKAIADSPALVR